MRLPRFDLRSLLALALEIAVPCGLIATWWIWSTSNSSFYFPPLPDILDAFERDWIFDRVETDLAPSMKRLGIGYAIATVVGIAAGTILALSYAAGRAAAPIVNFLRSIPPPALIPFGIVALGIGDTAKIFLIAFVCLWPILLNTIDGVAGIDLTLVETARTYRLRRIDRLFLVTLPAASPQISAGMRTSLSLSIIMMVISEMVASSNGVGYYILEGQRTFAIPEMWAGMILLGILGYTLNLAYAVVERRVLRWHRGARGSEQI
jgi:ABC-type nitrate/sulfonate/bicarbonate transport system permease component